jgi:hypothetical protein
MFMLRMISLASRVQDTFSPAVGFHVHGHLVAFRVAGFLALHVEAQPVQGGGQRLGIPNGVLR